MAAFEVGCSCEVYHPRQSPSALRCPTRSGCPSVLLGAATRAHMHAGRPVFLMGGGSCYFPLSVQLVVGHHAKGMLVQAEVVVLVFRGKGPGLRRARPAPPPQAAREA